MSKVIAHIDLNAFFASVEQIEQPSLRGKPIAIGGDSRRGIVVTASYEARQFGVKAGMPTYLAKQACPNLIIVGHHFDSYRKYSRLFKTFISRFASKVEMGSIDECFADFSHIDFSQKNPKQFFSSLQKQLLSELKLPSSWGIAPTKFLAKMASDMKKPMGITFLRKRDIAAMLYPLPIKDMYGIGKKTYPRLEKEGIKTIGDLMNPAFDERTRWLLGKFYFTVQAWLKGEGDDEVDDTEHDPKSIGNSSTLHENTSSFEEIKPVLFEQAKEVAARAGKHHLLGKTLTVHVKTPDFKVYSRSKTLSDPIQEEGVLLKEVEHLFLDHFKDWTIRLVGVSLHQLIPIEKHTQSMSLFDSASAIEQHNETDNLIEKINAKMKKKLIKRASQVKIKD